MRSRSRLLFTAIISLLPAATALAASRETTSFDPDWRFLQKDISNAQDIALDDSAWRHVDVPHDWSIEGPIVQSNPSGQAGGFFPSGIAIYRKHFSLPDADSGQRVFIDFDGVMANSDVWINGFHLGNRPYGYVSFEYELTGHLNFGAAASNVLVVRSDTAKQPASRYYFGAGINRHVRLVVTDPVHLDYNSVFVSTPQVTPAGATIHVQGTITNQGNAVRQITPSFALAGPDGAAVQITADQIAPIAVDAGKSVDFSQDLKIESPKLWDLDHPQLYKATVTLTDGATAIDNVSQPFGIRTFKFDPATGFILNGKNIRIQGVCLHADASAFGVAVPLGAWQRRLAALKEWGINGIRLAHNPPNPALLDLCDRMGFIVMDEMFDCWDVGKNTYDYHIYFDKWSLTDLRDTVRRDRNHPSIFLYSAGNEIHDTPNGPKSVAILSGLVKEFHANDPTRPVTQALFRPNTSHDYEDGLAALLDVVGTNYRMSELLAAQQNHPTWPLIGTENHYTDVPILAKNPPLAGIFVWSGVDYLGESHVLPGIHGNSGYFDQTDLPKAIMYETAVTWDSQPFVRMMRGSTNNRAAVAADGDAPALGAAVVRPRGPSADWTPENLNAHPETVAVYSNCSSVELFLNNASVGKSSRRSNNGTFTFSVPFASGTLKAVGYDKAGKSAATQEFATAGPAAKIVLTPDSPTVANDWDSVDFIRATITDANGVAVPGAANEIAFKVSGPGVLAAVDSADGNNPEPFQSGKRKADDGICFGIIKANASSGAITITATTDGLTAGTITVNAAPASAP